MEDVCAAIERCLDQEESQAGTFYYQGAYLRYALERALYFEFTASATLFKAYEDYVSGRGPAHPVLANRREQAFWAHLVEDGGQAVVVHSPQATLGLVAQGRRATQCLVGPPLRAWRSARFRRQNGAPILIHVEHEKFARYLRPVVECLSSRWRYLITARRPELKRQIRALRHPYIDASRVPAAPQSRTAFGMPPMALEIVATYDHIFALVRQLVPTCIVVVEGNRPTDEILNQVGKNLEIPVVCVQQGWSPIIHNGFRNMSFDRMLVWGPGFAELLRSANPDQVFVPVGNPSIDQKGEGADPRERRYVTFFLQAIRGLVTREAWKAFLALARQTAVTFPATPVIVREHPDHSLKTEERTGLQEIPNLHVHEAQDYPLGELLRETRVTVSLYSSTILESIPCGAFPVVFNPGCLPHFFPDIASEGAGIETASIGEALEAIGTFLNDEDAAAQRRRENLTLFSRRYFLPADGNSCTRAAREIEGMLFDKG